MTASPPPTLYHRWMGWHAPALRRVAILACIGLAVALVLLPILPWQAAVVAGWDAAAFAYLMSTWPIILRADSAQAEQLATREDETRGSATVLLLAASLASLLGVGGALGLAGRESGPGRILLIGLAVLTVLLSWTVVNTVYTLHYAHRDFGSTAPGITFGDAAGQERPTYRDFAYVAFTIGMTYQVSDTTVRDVSPSGKLPFSWPHTVGHVPFIYSHSRSHEPQNQGRRYWDEPSTPLFPFGHGLSYGRFIYSDLIVDRPSIPPEGTTTVSVQVTNASDREAAEVVQLYLHQRHGAASRPVRELKGFQRVTLSPQASQQVQLKIGPEHRRYWSTTERNWVLDSSIFDIWVGGSSTAELTTTFEVVRT